MSDDDSNHHDFGDLFGSENEASDVEDFGSLSPRSDTQEDHERYETSGSHLGKRSSTSSADGFSDDDEDAHQNVKQRSQTEIAVNLPIMPLPTAVDNKFHLAKLPRYLDIDPAEFDPDNLTFHTDESMTDAQAKEVIRQQVENTIRWRVREDGVRDEIETNSNFVEWEDGTMSLFIGKECFDVTMKPMEKDEHVFLLAHQTTSGVLESHLQMTNQMTFRPSSLASETHRHLTAHIADQHTRKAKTKAIVTEVDPERAKHELEVIENERLRAQRKLESQRRKTDIRYSSMDSRTSRARYDFEDTHGHRSHHYQDKYEEDFVVDDDEYDEEEDREREARLAQAKQSRMDSYRRMDDDEEEEEDADFQDEDEEEMSDQDEEEEEEEMVVRRHKRKQIMSDEDDE